MKPTPQKTAAAAVKRAAPSRNLRGDVIKKKRIHRKPACADVRCVIFAGFTLTHLDTIEGAKLLILIATSLMGLQLGGYLYDVFVTPSLMFVKYGASHLAPSQDPELGTASCWS